MAATVEPGMTVPAAVLPQATAAVPADAGESGALQKRLDYIAETHFLTEREREVMELAYHRMTNPEIAEKLCISKYTVKNHMHNIFEKLDISARADLIMFVDKGGQPGKGRE